MARIVTKLGIRCESVAPKSWPVAIVASVVDPLVFCRRVAFAWEGQFLATSAGGKK